MVAPVPHADALPIVAGELAIIGENNVALFLPGARHVKGETLVTSWKLQLCVIFVVLRFSFSLIVAALIVILV